MAEQDNLQELSPAELITWTQRFNEECAQRLTPEARQLADLSKAYSVMEDLIANPEQSFGEDTILQMHKILSANIPQIGADGGKYYTQPRRIMKNPKWEFVPFVQGTNKLPAMNKLGKDYEKYMAPRDLTTNDEITVIHEAADVITRICHIHPFLDGNGRLSKLIADSIFLRAGLHQVPFWTNPELSGSERKTRIHQIIIDSVKGNETPLIKLLTTEQIRACTDESKALRNDPRTQGLQTTLGDVTRQEEIVKKLSRYLASLE